MGLGQQAAQEPGQVLLGQRFHQHPARAVCEALHLQRRIARERHQQERDVRLLQPVAQAPDAAAEARDIDQRQLDAGHPGDNPGGLLQASVRQRGEALPGQKPGEQGEIGGIVIDRENHETAFFFACRDGPSRGPSTPGSR